MLQCFALHGLSIKYVDKVHRGEFCHFPFRWIYYCHISKSTGKETCKTHFCQVEGGRVIIWSNFANGLVKKTADLEGDRGGVSKPIKMEDVFYGWSQAHQTKRRNVLESMLQNIVTQPLYTSTLDIHYKKLSWTSIHLMFARKVLGL